MTYKVQLIMVLMIFSTMSFAKIIKKSDQLYVKSSHGEEPITLVNNLMKEGSISKITIFANGSINLLSFAKKGGSEKIYSVDEKGFAYAIEPFASYTIEKMTQDGRFQFHQRPAKQYYVNAEGFFLH